MVVMPQYVGYPLQILTLFLISYRFHTGQKVGNVTDLLCCRLDSTLEKSPTPVVLLTAPRPARKRHKMDHYETQLPYPNIKQKL